MLLFNGGIRKNTVLALLFAAILSGATAHAQGRTSGSASDISDGAFDRLVAVTPNAGAFSYTDTANRDDSDFILGANIDWNISRLTEQNTQLFYGVRSGLSYTPLNSAPDGTAFLVPINGYLGYHFLDRLMGSVNAGANLIFQGDTPGILLTQEPKNTTLIPNVGAQVGYELTQNFAAVVGLNWYFAPESTPFQATLGVAIPLV